MDPKPFYFVGFAITKSGSKFSALTMKYWTGIDNGTQPAAESYFAILPLPIIFTEFLRSFNAHNAGFSGHTKTGKIQFPRPLQNTLALVFVVDVMTVYPQPRKSRCVCACFFNRYHIGFIFLDETMCVVHSPLRDLRKNSF